MPIPDVQPAARHRTLDSTQWANLLIARRQRLARVGKFITRGLVVVIFCAAIGVAVAVLVGPLTIGEQSLVPASSAPRSAVSSSGLLSVEQVAAKVLPSVVTLETKVGGETELGSGIVLTSDGLIMTNNHVVAPIHAGAP